MKRVVFHPEAEAEFLAAARFYETHRSGLPSASTSSLRCVVRLACSLPTRDLGIGSPSGFVASSSADFRTASCTALSPTRSSSSPWRTFAVGRVTGADGSKIGLPSPALERTGGQAGRCIRTLVAAGSPTPRH